MVVSRASVCKHTRITAAFARVKEPPYTAAGQIESRFVLRFTPVIEQRPEEAQTPLKESYQEQQTLLLPHRTWRSERRSGDSATSNRASSLIWRSGHQLRQLFRAAFDLPRLDRRCY